MDELIERLDMGKTLKLKVSSVEKENEFLHWCCGGLNTCKEELKQFNTL